MDNRKWKRTQYMMDYVIQTVATIPTFPGLWTALITSQNTPFQTSKGLSFTYTIKGNELFISRKKKSITRATVKLAYERAIALGDMATGPKTLGCFGASYL